MSASNNEKCSVEFMLHPKNGISWVLEMCSLCIEFDHNITKTEQNPKKN